MKGDNIMPSIFDTKLKRQIKDQREDEILIESVMEEPLEDDEDLDDLDSDDEELLKKIEADIDNDDDDDDDDDEDYDIDDALLEDDDL
jgi:hypothetical protein